MSHNLNTIRLKSRPSLTFCVGVRGVKGVRGYLCHCLTRNITHGDSSPCQSLSVESIVADAHANNSKSTIRHDLAMLDLGAFQDSLTL